jgi:hypothetical protein
MVVNDGAKFSVDLCLEDKGGSIGRVGFFNVAFSQAFVNVFFECCKFFLGLSINFAV